MAVLQLAGPTCFHVAQHHKSTERWT